MCVASVGRKYIPEGGVPATERARATGYGGEARDRIKETYQDHAVASREAISDLFAQPTAAGRHFKL